MKISEKNLEESSSSTDTAGRSAGSRRPYEREDRLECLTTKRTPPGAQRTLDHHNPTYPNTRKHCSVSRTAHSRLITTRHSSSGAYRDPTFIANGVRDWKNILAKLQKHADGAQHCHCTEQWQCFEQTKATGSVAAQLSESHRTTVQGYREYAASIVDILLYLGKQSWELFGTVRLVCQA